MKRIMNDIMRILFPGILVCACDVSDKPSNPDIGKSVYGNWATKHPVLESDEGGQIKIGLYQGGRMSFEKKIFEWNGTNNSWALKSERKSSPNSEYVMEKDYLIMKIKSLDNEDWYTRLSPKYEVNQAGNLIIQEGLSYEGNNGGLIGIWTSDYFDLENGKKTIDTFYVSQDSVLRWRYGSGIKVSISDSVISRKTGGAPFLNYEISNGILFVVPPNEGLEYFRY
jgi:hypothetical protein